MTTRIWRTFQGAVLLLVVAVIGMVLVLAGVGHGIDRHQAEKEARLVELRLSGARQTMVSDLTAATIWDEAVVRLTNPVADLDWMDHHMGPFFAAQSGHVATILYNGAGEVIRVSLEGAPATTSQGAAFIAAAAPLVSDLRRETVDRPKATVAMEAVRSRSGFVAVNGRFYQVGVTSVVRHTPAGPVPALDPVVASFKPFETAVSRLAPELGLHEPRFVPDGEQATGGPSVVVTDPSGRPLGQIQWRSEAHGASVVAQSLPLLIALVAAMGLAAAWLFRSIARDVQQLSESEAALSVALERAETGSAAKSRFLANVSHELRTPLNGVLGMAEVLEGDLLTPQQRDRMAILKAAGKAQLRLIENLLLVTRLQSEAVTLEPRAFSPADLLRRLGKEWRPVARAKGLSLTVSTGAPDEWTGDEHHLHRVLDAVLDNAVRLTEAGAVTLSARRTGKDLVITIDDDGPGVSDAVAAYIARRGDGERPDSDGAGLGLPIAFALVSMMGGQVSVEAREGRGTSFQIRIPSLPAG